MNAAYSFKQLPCLCSMYFTLGVLHVGISTCVATLIIRDLLSVSIRPPILVNKAFQQGSLHKQQCVQLSNN